MENYEEKDQENAPQKTEEQAGSNQQSEQSNKEWDEHMQIDEEGNEVGPEDQ
ncbi:hypothetical protein [Pedobacter deserti]|uniref:hypothetical protein n=1 Tax=Pedobacter deserti TaxID=2817382 RepID=UPI00210DE152|nr:hypothetical protein [Pedobacter sp. SYSU D00382]